MIRRLTLLVALVVVAVSGCGSGGGRSPFTLTASRDCLSRLGLVSHNPVTTPQGRPSIELAVDGKDVAVLFGRNGVDAAGLARTYRGPKETVNVRRANNVAIVWMASPSHAEIDAVESCLATAAEAPVAAHARFSLSRPAPRVAVPRPASSAVSGCGPRWRVVVRAGVPPLNAVVALSSTDVWAVGGSEEVKDKKWSRWVSRPVIVHWDGRRLRTVRFPWKNAEFHGVAAVSSRDVWAVGSIDDKTPLAAHWDGDRWQRAQLPPVVGDASLADVAAVAAGDVWAVGDGGVGDRPLVMHWDGQQWQVIDMRGIAPRWSDLLAIDSASANDVWAAGAKTPPGESYGWSDLVLHWNGRSWKQVASHLEHRTNGAFAWAVDIAPSGEVWTLNEDLGGGVYFVRWSGRIRSISEVYTPADDAVGVADIAAASRTDVWAVGSRGGDLESPLVVHWDGTSWRPQPTSFDTLKHRYLNAILAVSPTDIWAVGNHLVARYSCAPGNGRR